MSCAVQWGQIGSEFFLGHKFFLNSLTINRSSKSSHGTVWIKQGSEFLWTGLNLGIYLHSFSCIKRFWFFVDCFFSTPNKIVSFRRCLACALWNENRIFFKLFVLFLLFFWLFLITTNFPLFSLIAVPGLFNSKDTSAVFAKRRKKVARSQRFALLQILVLWDKKF